MRRYKTKQAWGLPALVLTGLALTLALAPWAAASPASGPAPPSVSTRPARVSGTAVLLQGTVDPHTLATTYSFQYGATTAYGHETAVGTLPASATATTSTKVSEPAPGILVGFHYRLVARNSLGSSEGHDLVYTSKSKTKSKKPGFVLPKTFPAVPLGGDFVLSGTLTGPKNGGREIVLEASPYPYTAAYVAVGAPPLTTATGAFSFHVADMRTNTKFRVATVGSVPVLTSSDRARAGAAARRAESALEQPARALFRLYGTVTPAEVGAHVFVQLEKPPAEEDLENHEKPSKLEKPGKRDSEKAEKGATFATRFSTVVKPGTRRSRASASSSHVATPATTARSSTSRLGHWFRDTARRCCCTPPRRPGQEEEQEEGLSGRALQALAPRPRVAALARDQAAGEQQVHHALDLLLDRFVAAAEHEVGLRRAPRRARRRRSCRRARPRARARRGPSGRAARRAPAARRRRSR